MNNGQSPSSFQARFQAAARPLETEQSQILGQICQVPAAGIVDSNYGNGEVKKVVATGWMAYAVQQ